MSILIFILGTILGSFLNVCIYRIPREESIVFPASHCTSCNETLSWKELVPVFSFLFQKGKCTYCGEAISPQYPIIEILNGLLYLILYYHFNLNIEFLFYSIVFSILIIISIIDLKTMIIPDSLNISLLFITILYKLLQYSFYDISPNILNSTLGLIGSSGLFLLIAILSKGSIGGGDIKLIGVLGFILGMKMSILNIFFSFILGAIISIFLLLFEIKERKDPIPFAPFICTAFIIVVLWGNKIINWYIDTFLL